MRLWSKSKLFGAGEGAAIYGENGWMLLTTSAWKAYEPEAKINREGRRDGVQRLCEGVEAA